LAFASSPLSIKRDFWPLHIFLFHFPSPTGYFPPLLSSNDEASKTSKRKLPAMSIFSFNLLQSDIQERTRRARDFLVEKSFSACFEENEENWSVFPEDMYMHVNRKVNILLTVKKQR